MAKALRGRLRRADYHLLAAVVRDNFLAPHNPRHTAPEPPLPRSASQGGPILDKYSFLLSDSPFPASELGPPHGVIKNALPRSHPFSPTYGLFLAAIFLRIFFIKYGGTGFLCLRTAPLLANRGRSLGPQPPHPQPGPKCHPSRRVVRWNDAAVALCLFGPAVAGGCHQHRHPPRLPDVAGRGGGVPRL